MKVFNLPFVVFSILVVGLVDAYEVALFKDAKSANLEIVHGTPASRHEFPYQVSLHIKSFYFCGGSIIAPQWVLTAAHCINHYAPSLYTVYAGMLNQNENHPDVQVRKVSNTIVHSSYSGSVAPYDIGLMQLDSPLKWTSAVKPLSLPQPYQEFTGRGWITGWGNLSPDNSKTPTTLQKALMSIMTFDDCKQKLINVLGRYTPLDTSMICVSGSSTEIQSACFGDSGGPLMKNGSLLGITSWTVTPCGVGPSVYTKVSHYIAWIRQNVKEL